RIDQGYSPDAIILDLGLPEMLGDEVHREIRKRNPDVGILIVTGYGDRDRISVFDGDSRTMVRQKPLEMDRLFEALEQLMTGT
ncbi:MAG TPA: response regulator, partial [Thermoanaerobaculia bacterium]|nr:response regulator [Thermoanaerobaculia bacterium]